MEFPMWLNNICAVCAAMVLMLAVIILLIALVMICMTAYDEIKQEYEDWEH